MNDLASNVRAFALHEGADLVGIAPVTRFKEAPAGRKPEDLLPRAQSVIVIAMRIPKGVVETIPSPYYQKIGYTDLNLLLSTVAYNVARFLEEHGYIALPVMSSIAAQFRMHEILQEESEPQVKIWGDFSHRHAAVEAGLGEIGASSLFLSPQFGPRVRLISVLSTARLKPDPKRSEKICIPEECGFVCVNACPAKALTGDGSVDHFKCRQFRAGGVRVLEGFKDISRFTQFIRTTSTSDVVARGRALRTYIGDQRIGGASCGVCLKVCPIAKGNSNQLKATP